MFSIDYIGASWCAPCRTVKPQVITLAHKFAVPLRLVDYDELEEPGEVSKLPTIRVWYADVLQTTIVTDHVSMLEAWLKKHVTLRVNGDEDF